MEPNRKSVAFAQFKMADDGSFSALFAPFNVVDKQGDLTLPGAFGKQDVIISAYGHNSWEGALPVGTGDVHDCIGYVCPVCGEKGCNGGKVRAKFFLDTMGGQETYKTVKNVGDLQEWSYALPDIECEYRQVDGQSIRVLKRITTNEVSPVLMGAGNGTQTLAIKKAGESLIEQIKRVSGDARELIDRIKEVAAMREQKDSHISPLTMQEAQAMKALFLELIGELEPVAEKHDALAREMSRFYGILNRGRE